MVEHAADTLQPFLEERKHATSSTSCRRAPWLRIAEEEETVE